MASLRFPFWVAVTSVALVVGLLLAGTVLARTAYAGPAWRDAAQHGKSFAADGTHDDCPWHGLFGGKPSIEPGQGGA